MINRIGYERLFDEYDQLATEEQQLISYVFRCFWVSDEEEYQVFDDEENCIMQPYRDAIVSIGSPDAENCIDAITNKLTGKDVGHEVIDLLEPHIWNRQLFNHDENLWFSIILGESYEEYMSQYCESSPYRKFMESSSGLREPVPNARQK